MTKFQTFIVILIAIALLWLADVVLIPLVLAAFLAMMLSGPVQRLEKRRVPRVVAVTSVVLVAFSVILGIGWIVGMQVITLAEELPQYEREIRSKIHSIRSSGGTLEKVTDSVKRIETIATESATQPATPATTQAATQPAQANPPKEPSPTREFLSRLTGEASNDASPAKPTEPKTQTPDGSKEKPLFTRVIPEEQSNFSAIASYLGLAMGPLGTAGIVIVFVFFMLLEREDIRDRMIRLVSRGRYTITTTAVDDGITRVIKFLRAQAIVNGTYGIAVAIGLGLIGWLVGGKLFPSFLLWGLLACVLRFIPYIGPWIAAAFPLALSLAVYEGFGVFAGVMAMFLVIELLSNNVMEPMLYGHTTGLSTMAILVSAVFWTWLWGPIGLLLSTPLTVVMMVVGRYVPPLKFLEVLLGDRPAMTPSERVYQRLLAGDEDEALAVAQERMKATSLLQTYDEILMPALTMRERDVAQGLLDEQRENDVSAGMRRIVEELGRTAEKERYEAIDAKPPAPPTDIGDPASPPVRAAAPPPNGVRIAVVPAHDEADEIAGLMLANLLRLDGSEVINASQSALASEMVQAVTDFKPHAVFISATPPAAVSHVRYLMRRLGDVAPENKLAVGVWTSRANAETLLARLNQPKLPLATSFKEAIATASRLTEKERLSKIAAANGTSDVAALEASGSAPGAK